MSLKKLVDDLTHEQAKRLADLIDSQTDYLMEVFVERVFQDQQWGGPAVDDTRSGIHWQSYILKQVNAACLPSDDFRVRMRKVAALAIAAMASYDRVTGAVHATQPVCECAGCTLDRVLRGVAAGGDMKVVKLDSMESLLLFLQGGTPKG